MIQGVAQRGCRFRRLAAACAIAAVGVFSVGTGRAEEPKAFEPGEISIGEPLQLPSRSAPTALPAGGSGWLGLTADDSLVPGRLVVVDVAQPGPAAQAGIKPQDLLLALNGKPLRSADQLAAELAAIAPGSDVKVAVGRGEQIDELVLKAAERPVRAAGTTAAAPPLAQPPLAQAPTALAPRAAPLPAPEAAAAPTVSPFAAAPQSTPLQPLQSQQPAAAAVPSAAGLQPPPALQPLAAPVQTAQQNAVAPAADDFGPATVPVRPAAPPQAAIPPQSIPRAAEPRGPAFVPPAAAAPAYAAPPRFAAPSESTPSFSPQPSPATAAPPATLPHPAGKGRTALGVRTMPVDPSVQARFGLPEPAGALVIGVVHDLPASRAGVPPGSVIVALDNKPVRSPTDLTKMVTSSPAGQPITLQYILPGGEQRRAEVSLQSLEVPLERVLVGPDR